MCKNDCERITQLWTSPSDDDDDDDDDDEDDDDEDDEDEDDEDDDADDEEEEFGQLIKEEITYTSLVPRLFS